MQMWFAADVPLPLALETQRHRICNDAVPMNASTTTKTTEREQWRARILRALAELDTDPPGLERIRRRDDLERDGTSGNREF